MRKVILFLGELEDEDIDWMVAFGKKRVLPRGTALIKEDDPIEALYIVLEGKLSVSLENQPDRVIAMLRVGEIVGELSYLDSRPPSATVRAHVDSVVMSVPRAQLEMKIASEKDFAIRFYRGLGMILASRLRRTDRQLGQIRDGGDFDPDDEELDLDQLDAMSLAGARFRYILKKLSGK